MLAFINSEILLMKLNKSKNPKEVRPPRGPAGVHKPAGGPPRGGGATSPIGTRIQVWESGVKTKEPTPRVSVKKEAIRVGCWVGV